jgi:hypothetical protein
MFFEKRKNRATRYTKISTRWSSSCYDYTALLSLKHNMEMFFDHDR